MISKEEFVEATGLRNGTFDIPGIGQVNMRELSVADRLAVSEREMSDVEMSIVMVVMSLCGPDMKPMFGPDEIEAGVAVVKGKSKETVEALQLAFLSVSGLDDKALEEAVGNSIEIASEDSSSASPAISATPPAAPSHAS